MSKDKITVVYMETTTGTCLIGVPKSSIPAFKQLVRRALNTWDHAPPEIKEFGDMVEHGRVLQDYYAQDSSKAEVKPKSVQAAQEWPFTKCVDCGCPGKHAHYVGCSVLTPGKL
jgi:hypothetical protein